MKDFIREEPGITLTIIAMLLVVFVLLSLVIGAVVRHPYDYVCIAHGYDSSTITWWWENPAHAYCVRKHSKYIPIPVE